MSFDIAARARLARFSAIVKLLTLPMKPIDSLHHCLYTSLLAPGEGLGAVPRIVKSARAHNALHGITGLLIFDGEAFCQWIEGPASSVETLMQRIRADTRHTSVRTLLNEPMAARRFRDFSIAYASFGGGGLMHALGSAEGAAARECVLAWLPRLDALG